MEETKKTIKKKVIIIRKKRKTLKSPSQKDEELNQKVRMKKNKKIRMEQQKKYLESLDEKEKLALEIAKDHLKSSFDLEKSIDFINWDNKK